MKKGFTLIELLVVVLIIGILSAVAVPQYQKVVARSRFATIKSTAKALADAQNVYYMANGSYANSFDELSIDLPSGGGATNVASTYVYYPWGQCYLACGSTHICGGCTLGNEPHRKITYFYYNFNTRQRACVVWDGAEEIYTEICKTETGKSTYSRYEGYSSYAY